MCGRFVLKTLPGEVAKRVKAVVPPTLAERFAPRFNIAPTQPIIVVRAHDGREAQPRELALVSWGLVPGWAESTALGGKMINARAETAHEKPAFRNAWKHRRCVVPADGFYEWKAMSGGKQPYYFHRVDGEPLLLAGLWEHWQDPAGNEWESAAILTTSANGLLSGMHDRMPVVLDAGQLDVWVNGASEADVLDRCHAMTRPYPADAMACRPVSVAVNRVSRDGPALIEPVAEPPGLLF